jgi:hypothetical protein
MIPGWSYVSALILFSKLHVFDNHPAISILTGIPLVFLALAQTMPDPDDEFLQFLVKTPSIVWNNLRYFFFIFLLSMAVVSASSLIEVLASFGICVAVTRLILSFGKNRFLSRQLTIAMTWFLTTLLIQELNFSIFSVNTPMHEIFLFLTLFIYTSREFIISKKIDDVSIFSRSINKNHHIFLTKAYFLIISALFIAHSINECVPNHGLFPYYGLIPPSQPASTIELSLAHMKIIFSQAMQCLILLSFAWLAKQISKIPFVDTEVNDSESLWLWDLLLSSAKIAYVFMRAFMSFIWTKAKGSLLKIKSMK